jgi:DNA-binding NtrC family response regulator
MKIALKTLRPSQAAEQPAPLKSEAAGAPILEQVVKAKEQAETDAILAALNSTRWNRKQAAVLLKIDYKALLYKMKKLGVEDCIVPANLDAPRPAAMAAAG